MIACSRCSQPNEDTSSFCAYCGINLTQIVNAAPQSYIHVTQNGEVSVYASSVAEAKLALKELKLKKKELALYKKQLLEYERQIRANYTQQVRERGSKFQGGGKLGRVVRGFQTYSRDAARRDLANQLAPYEQERRELEAVKTAIEQAILRVEIYINENS
jgi:hypothetical protein